MDFHNRETRKAAKEHRCVECRGTIAKGETYAILTGVCEGEFYTAKICCDCEPMYDEANAASWSNGDEGVLLGSLYEELFEEGDPKKIAAYISTKVRRGALVRPWMWERLKELQRLPA